MGVSGFPGFCTRHCALEHRSHKLGSEPTYQYSDDTHRSLVLDPSPGIGTDAVSCRESVRDSVGVERAPVHYIPTRRLTSSEALPGARAAPEAVDKEQLTIEGSG